MLFRKQDQGRYLVGVDIGSHSVKLCELDGEVGAKPRLLRFAVEALPEQTIVDGHVMNTGAVVEALEKLFKGHKRREVALRVSGHGVIIRKVTIPLLSADELEEQAKWEAEQHIPFSLNEVQVDYEVLARREALGQMDVLLVAAKKDEIRDISNLASEARLRPRVIDLDAFAIQNLFEIVHGATRGQQHVALVHIGASMTTLNVLYEGTSAFTRDISGGGAKISDTLQRQLGISHDDAETLKCSAQLHASASPEALDAMRTAAEELAGEVQRTLDFYLASAAEPKLNAVFLTGGSARLLGLVDAIADRTDCEVDVLDATLGLEMPGDPAVEAEFSERNQELSVALGLALRRERERFE